VAHAQCADHRQLRAAPEREENRKREGERDAEAGEEQRQDEPAPAPALHVRQSDQAAPHEHADDGEAGEPDQCEPPAPEVSYQTESPKPDQQEGRKRWPPMLLERIGAEENEPGLLVYEAPSRAASVVARPGVGPPHRVDERPVDEWWNDFP